MLGGLKSWCERERKKIEKREIDREIKERERERKKEIGKRERDRERKKKEKRENVYDRFQR